MPKFLKLQEGWLTVGLLALLLFSVTLSVQHAQWSDGLSILTPITLIGLLSGIALAKIKGVPRFLLDIVGLEIGLITILLAVASILRDPRLDTVQERVRDLLTRTATWIGVAVRQDMSDDLVVFVLSLAVVAWVLAYSSAYFVFRSRQLWWALVPNGVALLLNLSYSVVDINAYIVVFVFSALLLMIRFNLLTKEERWQRERVNYSPGLTWAFLWTGSSLSVALALSMWFVPATSVNGTLNSMWERVNQPWVDFQGNMSRLWSQLPGNQSFGGYSSFNKSFALGGALSLSNSVALVVKSPSKERLYLRAATYDSYNGVGWDNTSEQTFHVPNLSPRLALGASQELPSPDGARSEVTYTVKVVNPKKDILFASTRPLSLTTPSRLEVSWRSLNENYTIDQLYPEGRETNLDHLPLELRVLVGLLHEAQRELKDTIKSEPADNGLQLLYNSSKGQQIKKQLAELKERGLNVGLDVSSGPSFAIHVVAFGEVPVYDDISSIRAVNSLTRNEQYSAVSLLSHASAADLQLAGSDYEDWLSRYMVLPTSVSQPIRDLAADIVAKANAETPYDKARAIEAYLRDSANFTYSTEISTPPIDTDPVEWFLFQSKKGYCTYFSASMIVMLRSVGIPARLATGYAPGTYDPKQDAFVVLESAAHAWPEVYFPGYGWVNFEPTPSQAVVTREFTGGIAGTEPTSEPTAEATVAPNDNDVKAGVDDKQRQDQASGANQGGAFVAALGGSPGIALILFGLVVIGAALYMFGPWRRRSPASAGSYYGRMLRLARMARVGPAVHQTPFEFSEALSREVRGTSLFTRAIVRGYVKERYGSNKLSMAERATIDRSWETLRSKLVRRVPSTQIRRIIRRRRP